jgi:hypothetical protein
MGRRSGLLTSTGARRILPFLLAGAASGSALAALGDDPQPEIGWGRNSYERADLVAALAQAEDEHVRDAGPEVEKVITLWTPWVLSHEYFAFELSDDARVLLISKQRNRKDKVSRERKLVNEVCEQFDRFLPRPVARPTSPEGSQVPKDEVSDHLAGLDQETAVLLYLDRSETLSDALVFFAKGCPTLASRLGRFEILTGVVIADPLIGICLQDPPGIDASEWKEENELVHRLSHLLMLRRFGELPFWIIRGISWHLEYEMKNQIYCFPDRNEFVAEAGHGGWDPRLRSRYRKIAKRSDGFDLKEAAEWPVGIYDESYVVPSWGVARYLARAAEPAARSRLLQELHLLVFELGRVYEGSRWTKIVDYQPATAAQAEVLRRNLGETCMQDMMEFFGTGKVK